MNVKMTNEEIQKIFINKYATAGSDKFYNFLITYALNRISNITKNSNPALELLEYYEMFLKLYRKENLKIYLDLSRQFRRAANKIYRIILKKNLIEKNIKFLNVIK